MRKVKDTETRKKQTVKKGLNQKPRLQYYTYELVLSIHGVSPCHRD